MAFSTRKYMTEFGGAMALYTAAVPLTVWLENRYDPSGAAALAVAMVPMVPSLLALWAFLRNFWRLDELERRTVSEAVVVAAAVVAFASFALGWVSAVIDWQPRAALIWVLPALVMVWGVSLFVVRRRYR